MDQARGILAKAVTADAPGAARGCDSVPWLSRYRFGDHGEYEVIQADELDERLRAWRLVYRSYAAKGYAQPSADELWYGLHDALPATRIFLVTRDGRDVATLSLVFDSPLRLPADEVYGDELNKLRVQDRRACEMVSLVSEETTSARCLEVLKHLFKLAYLTATRLEGATDMVITVHPHHAAYYERRLLFEAVGGVRDYGKVGGAPAVLLRLDLQTAEARYEERYGDGAGGLFRFFIDPETEPDVVAFLGRRGAGLSRSDLATWFERERPLLSQVSAAIREYLRGLYRETDESRVRHDRPWHWARSTPAFGDERRTARQGEQFGCCSSGTLLPELLAQ